MISWRAARALAMALPETEEKDHFGSPAYRIRNKIFAQLSSPGDTNARGLVKLSPADQEALALLDPGTFLPAPHWGRYGWTYVELASIDESTYRDLLDKSWRNVAPKQLAAAQGQNGQTKCLRKNRRGQSPNS
jgi:hypothetical protein